MFSIPQVTPATHHHLLIFSHFSSPFAGTACYRAGIIGHVGMDFVTLQEQDGALRLWAVDLDPHVTPSLMGFQIFDFLTVRI